MDFGGGFDIRRFCDAADELDGFLSGYKGEDGILPENNDIGSRLAAAPNKKLLVIGNEREFLIKSVVNEATQNGYECAVCPPVPQAVSEQGRDTKVYVIFIDSAELIKDLLGYLKDTAYDKRTEIGLVGERLDLQEALKYIGREHVGKLFERPVDAKQICGGVKDLFEQAEKRNERKRVLIVDDDPVCLKRSQAILHKHYKVYTARSAIAAVRILAKHKVDLILLDYVMPVIDGPRFLTALRLEPETETVPVMFLSSQTDSRSIIEGMKLGSANYISKTLAGAQLAAIISDFFAKSDYQP